MASITNTANFLSTIDGFSTKLNAIFTNYVNIWTAVPNNLKTLVQMENIQPDGPWFLSNLKAVKLEWYDIVKEVSNI